MKLITLSAHYVLETNTLCISTQSYGTGLCNDFNYVPSDSFKYKIHSQGVDCCYLYSHSHADSYGSKSNKSTIQWETQGQVLIHTL